MNAKCNDYSGFNVLLWIIIGELTLNSACIKSYKMAIRCRDGIMGMKFKFFSKKDCFTINIHRFKLINGRQFDLSKAFSGFEFVFSSMSFRRDVRIKAFSG